jgi:hypothetical protein
MATILARGARSALRAISSALPCHTKRLVFWSVLYSRLQGGRATTKEQCDRLNQALVLCKDNDALMLPTHFGTLLWKDLDDCSTVTDKAIRGEKTIESAAREFICSIPQGLRYASDALMLKDFQALLSIYRSPV